jgi:hypothetical protein
MKSLLALCFVFFGTVDVAFAADDKAAAPDKTQADGASTAGVTSSLALTSEGQSIVGNSKALAQAIQTADAASGTKATALAGSLATYMDDQESCRSKEVAATTYCLEKTNPGIAKALPIIQTLVSGISASISDSCSTLAKAMNIANEALLAYQATCAAAKGVCNYSCSGAVTKIKKAQTDFATLAKTAEAVCKTKNAENATAATNCVNAIETPLKALTASISKEANVKQDSSVAQKNNTCSSYATQLASALVGSIGVIKTMSSANSCSSDTTTATTASTDVDCTLEANATNTVCICKATPRAAGCSEGLDTTASAMAADSLRGATEASYTAAGNSSADLGTIADSTDLGTVDTSNSTGSSGAVSDGGSGGLGGSSSLGSAAENKSAQQKASGYNTNIYSGDSSGGGGGGSWGGYGGDGSLRQYLPGGKKDPTKAAAIAAQAAIKKEVTSEGGKSNWEKIRERYRDQKSTLIDY